MTSILRADYQELFEVIDRPSSAITYWSKTRVFGLAVLNGPNRTAGNSVESLFFCPFTGKKLPRDLVDEWFEEIERLGLEPDDPDIPPRLLSETWWIEGDY